MSTQETPYTESINTEKTEINDELIVTNDPVMKTAIDTLTRFSVRNKLVLKAYGDIIPNAVAIIILIANRDIIVVFIWLTYEKTLINLIYNLYEDYHLR